MNALKILSVYICLLLTSCASNDPYVNAMFSERLARLERENANLKKTKDLTEKQIEAMGGPDAANKFVIVWINASNQSQIPVRIGQRNDGLFIGPKGEFYQNFPTKEQLIKLYGY